LKLGTTDEKESKRTVKEKGADGQMHDVEKKSSKGTETNLSVSKDGASVDHGWSSTSEGGPKRKGSVGAEFDKGGNASVNASYNITDKDGRSFKVSGHAGVQVIASEPKQVGTEWVVSYSRTKSIGGSVGGSAKVGPITAGVTASGSASD